MTETHPETGMPIHLRMGVNAQGQGPCEPPDPEHVRFVCWTCYVEWPCPDQLEQLAREAEAGYDLDQLRPRQRESHDE